MHSATSSRAKILHHDIEEVDQQPWVRRSVALLGDAALAMTPNFGQGAGMAIGDATVLARGVGARSRHTPRAGLASARDGRAHRLVRRVSASGAPLYE